jgi:oligoribonuclease NrnB/cAMP/cGMP phosphodiesterase (DHH superfamily)
LRAAGATLAWQFFHDNQPIPDFLRYIEDRDLWNWRLPLSEEVNAAIMAHPATIANFDSIFLGGRERLEELKEEGKHIQKFANRAYQSIASKSVVLRYKSTGHRVAVVNSSVFKSEVGNLLAEREDAEFGLVWHFDHFKKNYWVSMRASRKNTVDVGALASQFGGGGHEKAAAFTFQGSDIDELFEPLPQVSASSTTVVSPTGDDAATAGALAAARIELLPIVPGEQGSGTNAK